MNTVTLRGSDALLIKETLESVINGEEDRSPDGDARIKTIIDIINIQLSEEEVRSPLSHLWKPM
jgi:hypothetical protein|tara:strand:+ start:241 stop:432 length:192 start_codon:yes stop_codon:yes gene_type:complete